MTETVARGTTSTAPIDQRMTLLDEAEYLARGAENARRLGDDVAFVALLYAACQRLELHKLLEASR